MIRNSLEAANAPKSENRCDVHPSARKLVSKISRPVACFANGTLLSVCIASIVRILTIHTVITSIDLTWAMGQLFIWSCCEPYIGIVCACLPTLAPFFRRWWITTVTKTGGSSNGLGSGDAGTVVHLESAEGPSFVQSNLEDTNKLDSDLRKSGSKREWLSHQGRVKVRDDDQIELTTNITGPESTQRNGSDEKLVATSTRDIRVKKDVTWSSDHLESV